MAVLNVLTMYGVGDCIAGRAVLRELAKLGPLQLETFYRAMFHDLGLPIYLRTNPPPRIRELANPPGRPGRVLAAMAQRTAPVPDRKMRLTYTRTSTLARGSQLAAQFASACLDMPERPDFSLPVPDGWRDFGRAIRRDAGGRPVMVLRPITLNEIWRCDNRSPDPYAYGRILEAIREDYHVVSIADVTQREWIVQPVDGPAIKADLELHRGELAFEELAGLFAEADLAFVCPGFAPILAQAVGTPAAIVYGGNERFSTTNAVGAHLAPTLAIEPANPCGCHWGARPPAGHACDKAIDVDAAIPRLLRFAAEHGRRRCAA